MTTTPDELADAEYVALTTFRRDGSPKATPVWIARDGDRFLFTTGAESWKVKRLRNDPNVEVSVSDRSGTVAADATVWTGTGRVLESADTDAAFAAIKAKYGWKLRLIQVLQKISMLLGRGGQGGPGAVELTIEGEKAA